MLAKAICIALVGYAYLRMTIPPKSGRKLSKTDGKIGKDGIISAVYFFYAVNIVPFEAPLLTLLYLFLLARGAISPDLKLWHVALTALCVFAFWLRVRAFKELNRYFTYTISIRPDHKLIGTGPYTYIRHPSYTGWLIGGTCFHVIMLSGGIWDAVIYPYLRVLMPASVNFFAFLVFYSIFVISRVHYEEAMLAEHFGEKWIEYASTRSRLIPFVY